MIEFNLGTPGSGKTYKGVYVLYSNFAIDKDFKDKKYKFNDVTSALTNINELDLTKFENVHKLDWDIFKESIDKLHSLYKKKLIDTDLIEVAKELNVYETLIVLDECHNYLDVLDKSLVWWLSYHRHLHQQIFLITQNLALVHTKYKAFAEFFYRAYPSSLKLFNNNMKYGEFTSSRLSNVSKTGNIKLPIKDEVFATYKSGAKQKSKNIVLKFIFLISFFLFLTLLIFYYSANSLGDKEVVTDTIEQTKKEKNINNPDLNIKVENSKTLNNPIKNQSSKTDDKNIHYMVLRCSINQSICIYKDKQIDLQFYYAMNTKYKFNEIVTINLPNSSFVDLHTFVNDKFYYIYNKKIEKESKYNDKNNPNSNDTNPFSFIK